MLASAAGRRQARFHDRRGAPRAHAAFDGLALLPRRHRAQHAGGTEEAARPRPAAGDRRLGQRLLQPVGARQAWRASALAVVVDIAAARVRSRAAPVAPIECAAPMAHNAAPSQQLSGSEWGSARALIPYLLEY